MEPDSHYNHGRTKMCMTKKNGFMRGKNGAVFFKTGIDLNQVVGECVPSSDFLQRGIPIMINFMYSTIFQTLGS